MQRKTIGFYIAITIVRMATKLLKMLGRNASHFPGWLALRIYPKFLKYIGKPEKVVFITGTNGKTTVSNLVASVLKEHGYVFLNNAEGSNIAEGITTSLLSKSSFFGNTLVPMAVLEVDERCAPLVYPYLQPDYLVCTNLFRDSYRRNAHVQFIWNILNQQIPQKTKLILNGEDLISSQLAIQNDRVHFGLSIPESNKVSKNIINDIATCPECGSMLSYDYIRYNHIGKSYCAKCGFKSPELDYTIKTIDKEKHVCVVKTPKEECEMRLIGDNITDAYNTIAAVAILSELGLSLDQIKTSFENLKVVATRFDKVEVNGKELVINLAKGQNPIACSRVCDFIAQQKGDKSVILILDDIYDKKDSSENTAWIYDADFEFLNQPEVRQIIIGGVRHRDYRLRMLMAGIDPNKIICCQEELDVAKHVDVKNVDKIFIMQDITTYVNAHKVFDALKVRMKEEG